MISTGNPGDDLPQELINAFARETLDAVKRYFAIPENQAKFEKWLEEQKASQSSEPS